jgi:hypothetical protein
MERVTLVVALACALTTRSAAAPPPPLPPKIAESPAIRALIESAQHCVDDDDGRNNALRAVQNLKSPIGSEEWVRVRDIVERYVKRREAARECINNLETARFSNTMSSNDREILTTNERELLWWWSSQGDYEAGILSALVGIKTDIGHYPVYMTHP